MKANYLFPNKYKKFGWVVLLPSVILTFIFLVTDESPDFLDAKVFAIAHNDLFSGLFSELDPGSSPYFSVIKNNIYDEILAILVICSALVVAFSREKNEDELISGLRLRSLVWATYVNYIVLLFCILFIYEIAFLWVMILNMATILLFFIIRFNWAIYKLNRQTNEE